MLLDLRSPPCNSNSRLLWSCPFRNDARDFLRSGFIKLLALWLRHRLTPQKANILVICADELVVSLTWSWPVCRFWCRLANSSNDWSVGYSEFEKLTMSDGPTVLVWVTLLYHHCTIFTHFDLWWLATTQVCLITMKHAVLVIASHYCKVWLLSSRSMGGWKKQTGITTCGCLCGMILSKPLSIR